MAKGCPHKDIRFCPLYIAAHDSALGCDDGELGHGSCAASRQLDYDQAIVTLRAHCPRLVAECRFQEEAAERQAQRLRNMKAARLH